MSNRRMLSLIIVVAISATIIAALLTGKIQDYTRSVPVAHAKIIVEPLIADACIVDGQPQINVLGNMNSLDWKVLQIVYTRIDGMIVYIAYAPPDYKGAWTTEIAQSICPAPVQEQ